MKFEHFKGLTLNLEVQVPQVIDFFVEKINESNTSTIGGTKIIPQILSHLYVNSVILTLDYSPMRGLIACD